MSTVAAHCCGADLLFNKKRAIKEYRKYLKKGPGKATAKIIEQLHDREIDSKSLIDVGGGIGALQWWFLQSGGKQTTDIDASAGYLEQAQVHASNNDWLHKTQFVMGDCTDVYHQVDDAHFITLDKVVCCYPSYTEIISATCEKAKEYVSLSYPMDGVIAQTLRRLGNLFFILTNNPFRPYVHPVSEIRNLFEQKGYDRVAHDMVFPWHVETYARNLS